MIRSGHGPCESQPRGETEVCRHAQGRRQLSKDDIAQTFHLPIERAARSLGVGLTVLKRQCREFGISRWPFRKMKSLERMLSIVEATSICNTKLLPMSGLQLPDGCMRTEAELIQHAVASSATVPFVPRFGNAHTLDAYGTSAETMRARQNTSRHIASRAVVTRPGGKNCMSGTARLDRLAALAAALLSGDGITKRTIPTQDADSSRTDALAEHSQCLTDAKLRALPRAVISSDDLLVKLDKVAYEYGYEIVRTAAQQEYQDAIWDLP